MRTPNTDYYKCRLPAYYGEVAKNVRLLKCVHEDLDVPVRGKAGSHLLYIQNDTKEEVEVGLVIQGHRFINCKTDDSLMEFKVSDVTVADCEQEDCTARQTIRFRHGRKHVAVRNTGFKEISCRGWLKWIVDNPGAPVQLWAGNLPARYKQWEPIKDAHPDRKMQTCELAYVQGCGSVQLGHVSGNQKECPALNCLIDPAQGGVTEGTFKFALAGITTSRKPWRQSLDSFDKLLERADD